MTSGLGPMNVDLGSLADFGEIGVLAQEAIARMDGIHVGDFGGADDGGNIQIAARALGRSDADGLVGEPRMQAVAVGFRIHGDGADAQILQAQMTRMAISPRLAIRIFWNIGI